MQAARQTVRHVGQHPPRRVTGPCVLLLAMAGVTAGETVTTLPADDARIQALNTTNLQASLPATIVLAELGAPAVTALVERLDRENETGSRTAWLALMRMVHHDWPADQRDAISNALVEQLHRDHSDVTRRKICTLLGYVGTSGCVDPLYKLLLDHRIRETVRQALIRIPHRKATQALVAGLQITEWDFRIALLDAIGQKGDPATFPILYSWSQSAHAPTRLGAMDALSQLPSRQAMLVLQQAVEAGKPEAVAALLRCGQTLMAADRTADARDAFLTVLREPDASMPIVVQAIVGLGRTGRAEDSSLIARTAGQPRCVPNTTHIAHAASEAIATLKGADTNHEYRNVTTQPTGH